MNTSREKANQLFPDEKWTKLCARVFISGTRAAQGMKSNSEHQKLAIEIAQARILAEYGHYVYLVPEAGSGKHYDAIVDGITTEFKNVTGGIGAVGKQYKSALHQGCNVFIRTYSKTHKEVYTKLLGETKMLLHNGQVPKPNTKVWLWIDGDKALTEWRMSTLIADASQSK